MKPLGTSQNLTIFPKPVGVSMIIGSIALGLFGAALLPFVYADQEWGLVGGGVFLIMLGAVLGVALIRKRAKGNVDPVLMLSPQGLHLMTGTTGVVPWRDFKSLGSFSIKGNAALIVNIDVAAMARLQQSEFFRKARKVDAAIGIHGLTFLQQSLEIPIPEVAQILHQYSIAHGGPALQPDP